MVAGSNKAALQQLIQCNNCTSASWEQLRFRCMSRNCKHRAGQAAGGDDEVMAELNPEDQEHVDEDVLVEEAVTPADEFALGSLDEKDTGSFKRSVWVFARPVFPGFCLLMFFFVLRLCLLFTRAFACFSPELVKVAVLHHLAEAWQAGVRGGSHIPDSDHTPKWHSGCQEVGDQGRWFLLALSTTTFDRLLWHRCDAFDVQSPTHSSCFAAWCFQIMQYISKLVKILFKKKPVIFSLAVKINDNKIRQVAVTATSRFLQNPSCCDSNVMGPCCDSKVDLYLYF